MDIKSAPSEIKTYEYHGKIYYLQCKGGKVKYQFKKKEGEMNVYVRIKFFPS